MKDQLRLAIDTIPGLVWTAQPDGHCEVLNQRWLEYTGLTLDEAKRWGWQIAVCPEDLAALLGIWRELLASGKPGEMEARLRRFDGQYRWFLFRAVPLHDEPGNVVKWYGTTTDIHDRKWAEALLVGHVDGVYSQDRSIEWPVRFSREGDMVGPHSFPPSPGTRFAVGDSRHFVPAQPTPRQNHLLAALSHHEYQRLLPDLEPCPLPLGWTIHDAGDRERYLYFITAGIVSRFCVTASGASAGFAVTGNEGVIGIAAFLGGGSTTSRAAVLSPGYSYRLRAVRLQHEFEHDGPLPRLLLRYTLALIAQIGLISACKRHHTLEQRLCRWILCCLDRLPTNEMALTQELIADMLGVRREGVTEALGRLQKAGLIRCSRGRIVVLDRPALKAHACGCYAVVKREYDGLLVDYRQADAPSWAAHPVTRVRAFPQQSDVRV